MRRLVSALAMIVGLGLVGAVPAAPADAAPAQAPARRPVLLVGGTFATTQALDARVKPWLVDAGYDPDEVHTAQLARASEEELTWWEELVIRLAGASYGVQTSGAGTARMGAEGSDPPLPSDTSAHLLDHRVDQLLAATGADEIDIIAHSQGAAVARHYVKFFGQDKVATLVSLGGVNYGIPRQTEGFYQDILFDLACDVPVCPQIFYEPPFDFSKMTPFFRHLNEGDPTPGDVAYYHLYTWTDELASGDPWSGETIPLIGDATNVSVQDLCGDGFVVHHVDEYEHPAMQDMMLAALERRPITSGCQAWTPPRCEADPGAPYCEEYG